MHKIYKYKVWVKPGAEMSFLYGNNVNKAGLAKITDGIPQYGGVIVYSMTELALGFGVAAQPTEYCRDLEPTANVVLCVHVYMCVCMILACVAI
jgi:60S ribosome subunit biogenesis protein NIP7